MRNKIPHKSGQNIWWLFGYFENITLWVKTDVAIFGATFGGYCATLMSNIWSHWVHCTLVEKLKRHWSKVNLVSVENSCDHSGKNHDPEWQKFQISCKDASSLHVGHVLCSESTLDDDLKRKKILLPLIEAQWARWPLTKQVNPSSNQAMCNYCWILIYTELYGKYKNKVKEAWNSPF